MTKPCVVIGNWKMNMDIEATRKFITELPPMLSPSIGRVCLAVPFTLIKTATDCARGTEIEIGAQDVSLHEKGAFTGEVSASMIQDAGGVFTLVGHSERRMYHQEKDSVIKDKVRRAILAGLTTVVCVGETQEQRDKGQTKKVLLTQLKEALSSLNQNEIGTVFIAYEPVWAIGTGRSATAESAQEVHGVIRNYVKEIWGDEISSQMPILYGGSVTPETIQDLIKMPDINGALVGGASLKVESFAKIINISRETKL